jgi:hypothetical protein
MRLGRHSRAGTCLAPRGSHSTADTPAVARAMIAAQVRATLVCVTLNWAHQLGRLAPPGGIG